MMKEMLGNVLGAWEAMESLGVPSLVMERRSRERVEEKRRDEMKEMWF